VGRGRLALRRGVSSPLLSMGERSLLLQTGSRVVVVNPCEGEAIRLVGWLAFIIHPCQMRLLITFIYYHIHLIVKQRLCAVRIVLNCLW